MNTILKEVVSGQPISSARAERLMLEILAGQMQAELVGALLTSFYFRPPSGTVLAGFARAFRQKAQAKPIATAIFSNAMDVCGTGGDGHGSFNVSTSVAFLAAACGQTIAKHGNRAVSSRCGSFDMLDELRIPVAKTFSEAADQLQRHGLTFLYAPAFHPALRDLAPIRRTLGIRTVLNALGPLLNPACVRRQLLGVYSRELLIPMAEALGELGVEEAFIVHGDDGSDEISLCSATAIAHLRHGRISIQKLQPSDFGFSIATQRSLAGGSARENADIFIELVHGARGPKRDIVVMNTAATLFIGARVSSFVEGVRYAESILDSQKPAHLLAQLQEHPQSKRAI